MNYLVYHQDKSPLKELLNIYNHTIVSSESFFLGALKNSQFCTSHFPFNLRFTSWQRNPVKGCHQKRTTVDWHGCKNCPKESGFGCSPVAFTKQKWAEIQRGLN